MAHRRVADATGSTRPPLRMSRLAALRGPAPRLGEPRQLDHRVGLARDGSDERAKLEVVAVVGHGLHSTVRSVATARGGRRAHRVRARRLRRSPGAAGGLRALVRGDRPALHAPGAGGGRPAPRDRGARPQAVAGGGGRRWLAAFPHDGPGRARAGCRSRPITRSSSRPPGRRRATASRSRTPHARPLPPAKPEATESSPSPSQTATKAKPARPEDRGRARPRRGRARGGPAREERRAGRDGAPDGPAWTRRGRGSEQLQRKSSSHARTDTDRLRTELSHVRAEANTLKSRAGPDHRPRAESRGGGRRAAARRRPACQGRARRREGGSRARPPAPHPARRTSRRAQISQSRLLRIVAVIDIAQVDQHLAAHRCRKLRRGRAPGTRPTR